MHYHNLINISEPTVEERVERVADMLKRSVMKMKPGDKLIIERFEERQPGDALITVQEITHE